MEIRDLQSERRRVQCVNTKPSLTEQAHKDKSCINKIIAKYRKTGLINHVSAKQGSYGDFLGVSSYQEALDRVAIAQDDFSTLPANIRKRFDNDPGKFLDFMSDEANQAEAMEMGLIPKPDVNKEVQEEKSSQEVESSET